MVAAKPNLTWQEVYAAQGARANSNIAATKARAATPAPVYKNSLGSSGRSGGGGGGGGGRGGGGGGSAAPTMTQQQLDWAMSILSGGKPQAQTATALDLPDYKPFDGAMYDQMQTGLNSALATDRAAATDAYGNARTNLTANYRNAFSAAPQVQAPGQSQSALARMLQTQGVDPSTMDQENGFAAGADRAFQNLFTSLGANEDLMQAGRLRSVDQDANTTNRALDIAGLQGTTGIGLQRSQAQTAWQQRADELAQREAEATWQRQNQVSDANQQTSTAYRNSQVEALLGLLPSLIGTQLTLPQLQQMGLA
jgi:hypothetical protein